MIVVMLRRLWTRWTDGCWTVGSSEYKWRAMAAPHHRTEADTIAAAGNTA